MKPISDPYVYPVDYTNYFGVDPELSSYDLQHALDVAQDLVDGKLKGVIYNVDAFGNPTDPGDTQAIRAAVLEEAKFLIDLGDISGAGAQVLSVSVGGVSVTHNRLRAVDRLAPDVMIILANQGLTKKTVFAVAGGRRLPPNAPTAMNSQVDTTPMRFFAGNTFTFMEVYNDAITGAPVDVTGYTAVLIMRSGSTILHTYTPIVGTTDGSFTVNLGSSDTNTLASENVDNYYLVITSEDSSQVLTLAVGSVIIQQLQG